MGLCFRDASLGPASARPHAGCDAQAEDQDSLSSRAGERAVAGAWVTLLILAVFLLELSLRQARAGAGAGINQRSD